VTSTPPSARDASAPAASAPAARRTLVVVESQRAERVEEALRAALGLTLRGAAVEVWLPADRPLSATARRAAAVLASFGHRVGPVAADEARDGLLAADAIEVWT
jgi:hypothetical protein